MGGVLTNSGHLISQHPLLLLEGIGGGQAGVRLHDQATALPRRQSSPLPLTSPPRRTPAVAARSVAQHPRQPIFELEGWELGPHDAVLAVVMEFCDVGSLGRALSKGAYLPSAKWSADVTHVSGAHSCCCIQGRGDGGGDFASRCVDQEGRRDDATDWLSVLHREAARPLRCQSDPTNTHTRAHTHSCREHCCGRRRRSPRAWPTFTATTSSMGAGLGREG